MLSLACFSRASCLGMRATESSAGEWRDHIHRVLISKPCPAEKKKKEKKGCSSNYEPVAAGELHLEFLLPRAPAHFAGCWQKKLAVESLRLGHDHGRRHGTG